MAKMSKYCKAYLVTNLEKWPQWSNTQRPAEDAPKDGAEGLPPSIVFLHDNYTVTKGIFVDEDVIYDQVTSEWKEFCVADLGFKTPETAGAPQV